MDQKLELERIRGEGAERRANILLGIVGASTAFMTFMADKLINTPEKTKIIVTLLYVFSACWLARTIWYSLKAISLQSRYRVTGETIFEYQGKSELNVMREVVAGKLWEYKYSMKPNTERLFYIQRAQRALVVFAGILLILGGLNLVKDRLVVDGIGCQLCLVFFAILFWLFGDYFIEKAGIWDY